LFLLAKIMRVVTVLIGTLATVQAAPAHSAHALDAVDWDAVRLDFEDMLHQHTFNTGQLSAEDLVDEVSMLTTIEQGPNSVASLDGDHPNVPSDTPCEKARIRIHSALGKWKEAKDKWRKWRDETEGCGPAKDHVVMRQEFEGVLRHHNIPTEYAEALVKTAEDSTSKCNIYVKPKFKKAFLHFQAEEAVWREAKVKYC